MTLGRDSLNLDATILALCANAPLGRTICPTYAAKAYARV